MGNNTKQEPERGWGTMAITVRGKNIDITPALKDYVEKRIGKITKYFENLGEITVILAVTKGRHIVEVTVPINGMLLRGEEATTDMYTSIDLVIEKLEKQIEKYKTKIARQLKHSGFKFELPPQVPVETEEFVVKPSALQSSRLMWKKPLCR